VSSQAARPTKDLLQIVAIVLFCIVSAVTYGIVHDQITARICVEYFTIGHPPVFGTQDPTLLGLGWGIIATWWCGVLLGFPLAFVARLGSAPKRSAVSLVRPVLVLIAVTGLSAMLSGIVGWLLASRGFVKLGGDLASTISREKHIAFLADLWAHSASYIVGLVGGLSLSVWVWRSRLREQRLSSESGAYSPG